MEIYWYFYGIILVLFFLEKKISNSKFIKILIVASLGIFLAIRYNVGNDYAEYLISFDKLKMFHSDLYYEPLYLLLCKLSPSFIYVIAVISIISAYLIYKIIQFYNPDYFYSSLLTYYGVYFVLNDIHLIRQGFAILIIAYGFRYLETQKFRKYLVFVLIAMGFHTSAIVALILVIIVKIKWNKQRRFIVAACAVLFYIGLLLFKSSFFSFIGNFGAFSRYAEVYNNSEYSYSYGISLGLLFDIILFIYVNIKSDYLSDRLQILLNIFTISIFIYIAFNDIAVVLRFGYYFRIVNIILIVQIRKILRPAIFYVALLSIYSYYYLETSLTKGHAVVEYHTIFDRDAVFIEY